MPLIHRHQVEAQLKRVGLEKKDLTLLLDAHAMTVHRWFADPDKRKDARPVPAYVTAFLAAYEMLTEDQRAELALKMEHKTCLQ